MARSAQLQAAIVKLVPGGEQSLSHLSDDELLTRTRRLVGSSNQLFAALLLHLAEVETRGIHRTRACASLYTYCIYELRMSEDAAARRSSAARLVKAFPILLDAIANGELHLTGLLMLGPHLTLENHVEVLARAKFRTKRELTKLVRELHPLPLVPDVVEPLGPELPRPHRAPTWEQWVTSLCPPVRELPPGERPRDWANDTIARDREQRMSANDADDANNLGSTDAGGIDAGGTDDAIEASTAPARRELGPITAGQQYQMQFSTSEEHVRLVERAKALLARTPSGASLGELHEQAMKLLVAKLEKEKFAVTERARRAPETSRPKESAPASRPEPAGQLGAERGPRREHGEAARGPRREHGEAARGPRREHGEAPRGPRRERGEAPRRRGRHVPAAVKREVFLREGGRCGYVDEQGCRCHETRYLELHHLQPFAWNGEHVAENLALRCAAHNALAAEDDFGRYAVEQRRRAAGHDSLAAQRKDERAERTPRWRV